MVNHMPSYATMHQAVESAVRQVSERLPGAKDTLLNSAVSHALHPEGKLMRPRLLLAAAHAAGGNVMACVPAAFAVEALHVGSLVHDDIIDNDLKRRGRPSVYGAYGKNVALVAGDSLMFRSFDWAEDCLSMGISNDRVLRAITVLARTGHELCHGQMLEEEIARRQVLDFSTYLSMVKGKTASLFYASTRMGAILGGAGPAAEEQWAQIGREFGMVFQMEDDLLPYRGDGTRAGKDPYSDIRNGRITLPWITAYLRGTDLERGVLASNQHRAISGNGLVEADKVHATIGQPLNIAHCEEVIAAHAEKAENLLKLNGTGEGVSVARTLLVDSLRRFR
ncbi:MAG: polyprenyl synthetase family protein [Kocuria sp.]|nr:polyprenyl synthetase family protein [Kocuria sp.]